jgi:hypothetical protein
VQDAQFCEYPKNTTELYKIMYLWYVNEISILDGKCPQIQFET